MRYDDSRFLAGPNRYALGPMGQLRVALTGDEQPDEIVALLRAAAEREIAAGGPADEPVVVRPGITTVSIGLPAPNRAWARYRLRRLAAAIGLDPALIGPDDGPPGSDTSEAPAPAAVPVAGITGTNGKSTTTRLLARMAREAGRTTGVATSDGVWIDERLVLPGDYTGPQGAGRALAEPGVEVGVLEIARGGILLKGMGVPALDTGVVTNVAADHLGLDGVETIAELALVKGTVLRAVRPGGACVINAADPWAEVLATCAATPPLLVAREPELARVVRHLASGGRAAIVRDGWFVLAEGEREVPLLAVDAAPVTLGGLARHNVENALAACAAAAGLGIPPAAIAAGLAGFRPTPTENPGRLNVFTHEGRTVVVDFAHNTHGLAALLDVGEGLARSGGGRVWVVIGTAGDRRAEDISGLGELAVRRGAGVIVKKTERYLRGRALDDLIALYLAGVAAGGGDPAAVPIVEHEVGGLTLALARSRPGDVICIMCQEQRQELWALLGGAGVEG